ncbi:MAG TPA: hypothetical protein VG603_07970, partial [Chitinophagales bacterium]|nr:hypothetical protein [Chitinophagales bacterium]
MFRYGWYLKDKYIYFTAFMVLAHIINPVNAPAGTELARIQPVTFESIRAARDFAAGKVNLELWAVSYPEDQPVIPPIFQNAPYLQRAVTDVAKFEKPKKYPLLADIIKALYQASNADYLIYTNMDIALMPQFYLAVNGLLQQGHDALLINRRGISVYYKGVDELPLMYSDYGVPHPGFDCFVFKRSLAEKFILGNICIGIPFTEVSLTHNLIAFAQNLKLVDNLHLTFHIGTEVMPPRSSEYYRHNRNQYEKNIYPQLKPLLKPEKFPYAMLPFYKR